jgi:hypothetical protein
MVIRKNSLNTENLHKILIVFLVGLLVVVLSWPICHLFQRALGGVLGFIVGLAVPPLLAWGWSLWLPFPWWTDSLEMKILAVVLSAPSAIGGAAAGCLQSKASIVGLR